MTSNQAQAEGEAEKGTQPASAESDSLNTHGKENESLSSHTESLAEKRDQVLREIEAATRAGNQEAKPEEAKAPETPEETAQSEAETKEAKDPDEEVEAKPVAEDGAGEPKGDADGELPERMRLTNFSKVEKLALAMKKENPKLSLAQAEAKAKDALGIAEEDPAKTVAKPSTAPELQTVEAVDAKIKELVALRTKATKDDLDFAEADRLTNEIEALREQKSTVREQVSQKATQAQAEYDQQFAAAETKAAGLYDFVKQAESAGFKRMAEIDRALESNKDPLFNAPDKALVIAQMVARELAIAPKAPGAKPAAAVSTQVVAKKVVPPVASGASRTSTATTQGDAGLGKKIAGLKTAGDIEAFIASIGR